MKKAIVATMLGLLAAPPALAAEEAGRVKTAVGAAAVQRGAQSLAAKPGLIVQEGDTLVTGRNGRIAMTFIDNTRFSAGPNSRISVSQFRYDRTRQSGTFVTRVDRGSLAVVSGQIAKSGKDNMKVATPTSLLGVRGTRFVVEVP